MKTGKRKVRIITIFILMFCATEFVAQVPGPGPYDIWNLTSCQIDFRWDIIDVSCGSVCVGSGGIVSIIPGGNITITAAMIAAAPCGGSGCDVIVSLLGPTGNNFPAAYFLNSAAPSTGGATENDCNNSSYTYSWNTGPISTTIW